MTGPAGVTQATRQRLLVPATLLLILAAVPVAAMLVEVLRAPRLHFLDYWSVFGRVTEDSGALNPRGIFTYQNEHPMFLPGLLFWVEAKLSGGRNQVLGVFDVVVTVGTLLILNRLLPRSLDAVKRAALTVAFAFLLFTTSGLHNFTFGFSGVGWLTANLAAVGALMLADRNRQLGAVGAGLAGCLCYGTAFAVWPALALVNWLRGRPTRWVVGPLLIGVGVISVWALTYHGGDGLPADRPLGLDSYLSVIAATLGMLWSPNPDLAAGAGAATALLLAAFTGLAMRDRLAGEFDRPQVPWLGVAGYACGAVTMISAARAGSGTELAVTSRYASIPALALAALLALAVLRLPAQSRVRVVTASVAVGLITYTIGASPARDVRGQFDQQQLLATAMRVRADDVVRSMRADPGALDATKALGAYPFNDAFTLGCGSAGPELGNWIDLERMPELPGPNRTGNTGYVESAVAADAVIGGWALVDGQRAGCVVVTDQNGIVVGGGVTGYLRTDLPRTLGTTEYLGGWRVVTPPGLTAGTVVVGAGGRLFRVTAVAKPSPSTSPASPISQPPPAQSPAAQPPPTSAVHPPTTSAVRPPTSPTVRPTASQPLATRPPTSGPSR